MKNLARRSTKWVEFLFYPSFSEDHGNDTIHLEYREDPLDLLPSHESMRVHHGWRGYRRLDECMVKARNIIHNSNGLHISEMRRKVKDALKYTRGYFRRYTSVDGFIRDHLETYEVEGDKVYYKEMDGRYFAVRDFSWRRYFHYEDMDGIIRRFERWKPKTPRRPRGEFYERITWQRKYRREERKDKSRMSIFYLKVTNHPVLMDYFHKMVKEYSILNRLEAQSKEPYPTYSEEVRARKGKRRISWEVHEWRKGLKAFTLEKRRRRDKIRHELDAMMEGDFSSYYKSRNYLWSLYKECHHFEQL